MRFVHLVVPVIFWFVLGYLIGISLEDKNYLVCRSLVLFYYLICPAMIDMFKDGLKRVKARV